MREIVATVTSDGQVTTPDELRRRLGLNSASTVIFAVNCGGTVELRPIEHTLESVMGSIPALEGRDTVDFEDLIQEALEDMADEEVRKMSRR